MNVAPHLSDPSSEGASPYMARSRRSYRFARVMVCLWVFAAYTIGGEIGLAVPFTSGNVSPLWPPAGVALAAILLFGYRVWPGIALGALFVNFFSRIPHAAAAGIAVGNTLGPLCGAWFLQQLSPFDSSLHRLRDVLRLCTWGALGGTLISASIGAGVLFLTRVNAWSGYESAWLMWWLGDAMGVLILTPLALTFKNVLSIRGQRRIGELLLLLLGAIGSAALVFGVNPGNLCADVFAFGIFPFVLWGAIRFEAAGASTVSALVSAIAVWGTAHGHGPFVQHYALRNAAFLQSFLAVTAVSGMMLAAVITERAQLIQDRTATEALEQSERRYRGIVETAYEGIWKIDADFITTFVNHRMAELLGYTVQEMPGRSLFDFFFEDDVEERRQGLQRRRHGLSEQIEARFRRKDGTELWARVTTSPILKEDGAFEGALAMVSDMTEEKRAAAEMRRSQEIITLLYRAMEQTADSVMITDRQGSIEYVNPAFESVTGYRRDEAIGSTPRILKSFLHDRDFYGSLWTQILSGEPFRGTLVNRRKSGELFWTEQTITPIKDSDGKITNFVSVLKDITELRKRQEQELQLRMAREVQQRFYAGAAICVAGFDIASAAHPAAETGGDYLDLFSMPDGRICIGIGDVSGHGLASALVMALTRAYVRSFAQVESDLGKILQCVNHMLVADLQNNSFVTLLLVSLDSADARLSYASAGHVPGFLINDSGGIEHVLQSSAPPLGLFEDCHCSTASIALKPRELLVLLTDGAIEMTASEDVQFGIERVLDHVRAHQQRPASELAEGIYRAARSFAGDSPQQDDVTAVIARVA